MKVGVHTKLVDPKDERPKSLQVKLTLDPITAQQVTDLALREGVPVPEMLRTLVVGSLAVYPSWGIQASDRRRAFDDQRRAILTNLYAWFNEQKWIMDQQIAEEERARDRDS